MGSNPASHSLQNLGIRSLDATTFNKCLDTDQTLPVVQADIAEATRLGIYQTPTFLVNSRAMQIQSLDYGQFARVFDVLR